MNTSWSRNRNRARRLAAVLALTVSSFGLSGCSLYPLGSGGTAHYYGGHGNGSRPNQYVARSVQRSHEVYSNQ